jgi:hypothetical protein
VPKIRLLGLLITVFLPASSALADDIVWDHPVGVVWSGHFVSPYYALDKSINQPAGSMLELFCLDYNDDVAPPFSWTADVVKLSSDQIQKYQFGGSYPGVLAAPFAFHGDSNGAHSVTMSAGSDAYHRYVEAAWLFTNVISANAVNNQRAMTVSQVAAWDLFVDVNHIPDLSSRILHTPGTWAFSNYVAGSVSTISSLSFRSAVDEALRAAQSAVLSGWLPSIGWSVVTAKSSWVQDANGGVRVQEFLSPYVAETPEPASWVLLLTAMGATLGVCRRRQQLRKG